MSVKLMSAIFETEFRDLTDAEGNITKASTAKLVLLALADHANDEGESAYPSIETLAKKTALSPQTIRNTFDALKYNGLVFKIGTSKYMTNNYTINTACYPILNGEKGEFLPLKPVDPSNRLLNPSNRSPEPLNRLDPNHQLTINESSPETLQKTQAPHKRGDLVDGLIELSRAPSVKLAARIDAILSYLAREFSLNTETKQWREFARFVDNEQRTKGWNVEVFVAWLKAQRNFDISFWTPRRMMEHYPRAFERRTDEERPQYEPIPERKGVPPPAHLKPPRIGGVK